MSPTIRSRLRALSLAGLVVALPGCEHGPSSMNEEIQAPRITLTPNILATTLVPGSTLQVTIAVQMSGGPTRANLSLGGSLPPGVTASFSPASVTDAATSTMTLIADSTAIAERFVYDIVASEAGTNFGVTGRSAMTGQIEFPFTITTSGSQLVTVGTTGELTIGVSRKPLFMAPVGLSILPASIPTGTAVSFAPPAATGANSTLRLGIPANAATGQWLVKAVGKYGASLDTALFLMTVIPEPVPPDITVVATPASVTVIPGASATYDLAFTRNEGTIGMGSFSQSVSGLPPAATATFTPTVPQTTTQMVVATTAATPDGTYSLTITAQLGTLVKTTNVTLLVATPPNFSIVLSPAAITINRGASGDVNVALARTGPASTITIDALSVPAGVTLTPSPAAVNGATSRLTVAVGAAAVPGVYAITVRGVSGSITRTAVLTLTIPAPPPSDVTITALTHNVSMLSGGTTQIPIKLTRTGAAAGQLLELRTTGVPLGGNAWITPSTTTGDSATLNVIAGAVGLYNVAVSVVRGSIPPTDIAAITVTNTEIGDFSILPVPQSLSVPSGTQAGETLQIGRTNGFTGAVSFVAITDKPADYQVTFSLSSTTGNVIGMTIYVSSNVLEGPHVMRIKATSGNIVHEVSMTVDVTSLSTYPYPPYYPGIKRPPE